MTREGGQNRTEPLSIHTCEPRLVYLFQVVTYPNTAALNFLKKENTHIWSSIICLVVFFFPPGTNSYCLSRHPICQCIHLGRFASEIHQKLLIAYYSSWFWLSSRWSNHDVINGTSFGVKRVSRYRIEADVTAAASLGNVLIQPTYRAAGNKAVLMSALQSFMGVGGPICKIEPRRGRYTGGGVGNTGLNHPRAWRGAKETATSELHVQTVQKRQFGENWVAVKGQRLLFAKA